MKDNDDDDDDGDAVGKFISYMTWVTGSCKLAGNDTRSCACCS